MTTALPIVVLISGKGSNMRVLAEHAQRGSLAAKICAVISNRSDAAGLEAARALGISTASLLPRDFADRDSFDQGLAELIERYQPQLLVLAGYMRVLNARFIERFAGRILNIHPSLLPKYPGLHTHRRALHAGESMHGASVHYVTEELDGGPVVIQGPVPVLPDDTEESLAARVQQAEHRIYPQAVSLIAQGRLHLQGGQPWLDGKPLDTPLILDSNLDSSS